MGRIIEKFRKDSWQMGTILGAFIPLALFGILKLLLFLFELKTGPIELVTNQKLLILSIVPNVLLLRYYLLKLKFDLTGRGILGVTFVIGIIFIIIEFLF